MRFGFTEGQERFRREVRKTLHSAEIQDAVANYTLSYQIEPDVRPLYRLLGEHGLLAVHWPSSLGGADRTHTDAAIVAEELVRARIPDTLHVNTIQIVGQFLLMAGSEAQKGKYLPEFARGERFASVLYTEPDAGSDLGALQTMAEADGDGYRITGTKTFSLKTRFADYGLCAARTAPSAGKYQGISLFLVDIRAPGVTVSLIPGVADEQYHRVELDGVFVSSSDLIGSENQGWPLINEALAIERTGLDYYLKAEHWMEEAIDALLDQDAQVTDTATLERIGRMDGALSADHVLAWNVLTGIAAGKIDSVAAAVAKYHSSELATSVANWAADIPSASQKLRCARQAVALDSAYREAPGLTLSAGTSEVMLRIISATLETI